MKYDLIQEGKNKGLYRRSDGGLFTKETVKKQNPDQVEEDKKSTTKTKKQTTKKKQSFFSKLIKNK